MNIEGLDKIYIIHYDKLKERKEYLDRRLNDVGLKSYVEWVISSKETDSKRDLSLYDGSEKALKDRRKIVGNNLPAVGKIDIIMILQHLEIMKKISREKGDKISMVCEDDVLLSDEFPINLEMSIQKLKKIKWDICYTDKGALFVDPAVKKKLDDKISLYAPPNKTANTTGSYLIHPESAKKIVKIMKRVSLPADLEMCYIQKKNNLKVYWTVPFLTHQGSIEYIYRSAVRKGSVTGMLLLAIRKIDYISPFLARSLASLSDKFRRAVYNSEFLMWIKDRFKSWIKY